MRIANISNATKAQGIGMEYSKSRMTMSAQGIPQRKSLTSISVTVMSGALRDAQALNPMRGGGMMSDPYLYKCNPEKNSECEKVCCQSCCFLTTRKEYSKDGKKYRYIQGKLMEVKENEV